MFWVWRFLVQNRGAEVIPKFMESIIGFMDVGPSLYPLWGVDFLKHLPTLGFRRVEVMSSFAAFFRPLVFQKVSLPGRET